MKITCQIKFYGIEDNDEQIFSKKEKEITGNILEYKREREFQLSCTMNNVLAEAISELCINYDRHKSENS